LDAGAANRSGSDAHDDDEARMRRSDVVHLHGLSQYMKYELTPQPAFSCR
jgi:hypothetical protein